MSMRYPGGLINGSPVTAAYPSGVWTPSQTNVYNSQNVWQYDQYWRNTTLLLHGDGTNGAQNNTFLDSSSNNFSITRNGNTTQGSFTPYQQNGYWSNYFNGSNSYLNFSDNTAFNFGTGDATVEFWFNSPGTSNSYPGIISSADYNTSGSASIRFDNTGYKGKVFMYLNGGGDPVISSTSVLAYNTWYHVAITRSGTSMKLYINGNLDTTVTISASLGWYLSYGGLRIGRGFDVDGGSAYFPGYISNVRLVKGSVVYASNFSPITTPLTAISGTSLLTCQSNRFIDNSSNAFAVTLNNSPSVQAFQPFPGATTWSASVLGGSGYFDGSGDYCTFSSNTSMDFGTGNFTIEGWFYTGDKSVSGGASRTLIGNSGNSYTMQVYLSTAGYMTFGNTGSTYLQGATDLANNAWHHFAISRTGTGTNQIGMWVDGVRVAQGTNSQNYTSGTIYLGSFSTTDGFWNGYISNLRIVKGSAVYDPANSSITVPTSPLTAITNTSLLLNFTNAGIFDNAQMNNLETVGNAQVSTSVVKYGTGSMAFDGSGDYLDIASTNNFTFGTGDFTVEFWIKTGSTGFNIMNPSSATGSGYWGLLVQSSDMRWNSAYNVTNLWAISASSILDNNWHHVAISRLNGSTRIFFDGVLRSTQTDSTNYSGTAAWRIGSGNLADFNGSFDEFRITKGVARYVTSFTPPIARMPNQ